jgi:uncharacterized protein with PQ loop repeat
MLIGAVSSTSALINIVLLQWGVFRCCRQQDAFWCFERSLGMLQSSIPWLCFMIVYVHFFLWALMGRSAQFVVYFPRMMRYRAHPATRARQMTRRWRRAVGVGIAIIVHFILTTIVSAVVLAVFGEPNGSNATEIWADILGLISTLFAFIQFMPQIYTTWKSKTVGALSIPTMAIQAPGSFVFAYTLATKPGSNITMWLTYVCSGTLQAALMVLCIVLQYRERRNGAAEDTRPLLSDIDVDVEGDKQSNSPVSRASTALRGHDFDCVPSRTASPSTATEQSISLLTQDDFRKRFLSNLSLHADESLPESPGSSAVGKD